MTNSKSHKGKVRLAIFASGSGTNAENIFRYFQGHHRIEVAAIFTNHPQAGVIERMQRHGMPVEVFTSDALTDGTVLRELGRRRIDWIILAGFLRKIPEGILEAYPRRILNIHPALLPKFGGKGMYGMRVHRAVIAAGECESGITIHYVDADYDTGPIIFQAATAVRPDDTPASLAERIHRLEYRFYPQVIENVVLKGDYSRPGGNP